MRHNPLNIKLKNTQRKLNPVPAVFSDSDTTDNPEIVLPVLSSGDLGQVQEILFGSQMRSNSEQLQQMQNHYDDRIVKLTEEFNVRLQILDKKTHDEKLESDNKFESLRLLQDEKYQQLSDAIILSENELKDNLNRAANESSNNTASLIGQFKESHGQLSKTVDSVRNDMISKMDDAVSALDARKLDRQALAVMLGSVSTQISDTPKSSISATADAASASSKP